MHPLFMGLCSVKAIQCLCFPPQPGQICSMEDLLLLRDDSLHANQFIVILNELERADKINYPMGMIVHGQSRTLPRVERVSAAIP